MSFFSPNRLDELTTLISSGSTPKGGSEVYLSEGPVMLIRSQNVRMNELSVKDAAYITDELDNSMARSRVQRGDVLLNITGASIGRVASFDLKNARANVNQHVCIIRPKPNLLDSRYLTHLIGSPNFQVEIDRLQHGGTRQALTFAQIGDFEVPRLALAEQRRIADVLDQAEALRAKRRHALAELDSMQQSIFIDIFGNPVDNANRWCVRSLSAITNKLTDGEHLNPNFLQHGMPIIMAGNVLDDFVNFAKAKFVDFNDGTKFRKKCKPEWGDILLVSRGATIGRLCHVSIEREFCLMGSVILIKPSRALIDGSYLCSLLKHPSMQRKLYGTSGSSAQQAIYLKDLKQLECIVPPLELQHAFGKRISVVEQLKSSHRSSLAELDALFASLQYRAFRGELFNEQHRNEQQLRLPEI